MSSTTTRSARRIRATARVTVSSVRWARTRTPRCSEGEPGDPASGLDHGLAEGFEEERLPGPGGAADDQVLPAVDPFQGPQRLLGGGGDGGGGRVPGVEGFAGGEPGRFAAGGEHRPAPAGDLFDEQGFDHLDRVPALRFRGRDQFRRQRAGIRHLQLPHQLLHLDRQGRGGAHSVTSDASVAAGFPVTPIRVVPIRAQLWVPWVRDRDSVAWRVVTGGCAFKMEARSW